MNYKTNFCKSILAFLSRPFSRELPVFVALFLMIGLSVTIHTMANGKVGYGFFVFAQEWITFYAIAFLTSFTKGLLNKVIKVILFIWATILSVIEISCFMSVGKHLTQETAEIIHSTNQYESMEFISVYISVGIISVMIATLGLSYLAYYLIRRYRFEPCKRCLNALLALTLICLALTLSYPSCLESNPLVETRYILKTESVVLNRHADVYASDPKSLPEHLVVIIGESLSRNHSSLYGYGKLTNPRLQSLADSDLIEIYHDVISPDISTYLVFKSILNTSEPDDPKWFEKPNIPTILKNVGYNTHWISNQAKYGLADNMVSPMSQLCDTAIFMDDYGKNPINPYDENLLPVLRMLKANDLRRPSFDLVHLIGNHFDYDQRYPESRQKFTASDYPNASEPETLANYDSSVAYNDSVVAQIIDVYSDTEALVIYFSDHGEDVFDSSDDYAGHGLPYDPLSKKIAKEIPYIVYVSPRLRAKQPQLIEKIRSKRDTTFCTSDFTQWLMDLLQIRFKDSGN